MTEASNKTPLVFLTCVKGPVRGPTLLDRTHRTRLIEEWPLLCQELGMAPYEPDPTNKKPKK